MKTKKGTVLAILLLATSISARSQVMLSTLAVNAGGDYQENGDIILTSSISEMACINTIFVPDLILSGGVLQPPMRRSFYDSLYSTPDFINFYPTLTTGNTFYLESRHSEKLIGQVYVYTFSGSLLQKQTIDIIPGMNKNALLFPVHQPGEYVVEVILRGSQSFKPYRKTFKFQKK